MVGYSLNFSDSDSAFRFQRSQGQKWDVVICQKHKIKKKNPSSSESFPSIAISNTAWSWIVMLCTGEGVAPRL